MKKIKNQQSDPIFWPYPPVNPSPQIRVFLTGEILIRYLSDTNDLTGKTENYISASVRSLDKLHRLKICVRDVDGDGTFLTWPSLGGIAADDKTANINLKIAPPYDQIYFCEDKENAPNSPTDNHDFRQLVDFDVLHGKKLNCDETLCDPSIRLNAGLVYTWQRTLKPLQLIHGRQSTPLAPAQVIAIDIKYPSTNFEAPSLQWDDGSSLIPSLPRFDTSRHYEIHISNMHPPGMRDTKSDFKNYYAYFPDVGSLDQYDIEPEGLAQAGRQDHPVDPLPKKPARGTEYFEGLDVPCMPVGAGNPH